MNNKETIKPFCYIPQSPADEERHPNLKRIDDRQDILDSMALEILDLLKDKGLRLVLIASALKRALELLQGVPFVGFPDDYDVTQLKL